MNKKIAWWAVFFVFLLGLSNANAEKDLVDILGLTAKDDGRGEMQVGVIVASEENDKLCPLLQKTLEQAITSICSSDACKKCRIQPLFRCVPSDKQTVLDETKSLVERSGVTLLIGPFNPSLAQPLADYAESAAVPLFLTNAPGVFPSKSKVDRWVFQLAPDPFQEFKSFLMAMRSNLDRILVLMEDTAAAHEAEVFLRAYATEVGLKNIMFYFVSNPAVIASAQNADDNNQESASKTSPVYKTIRGFEAGSLKKGIDPKRTAVVSLLPYDLFLSAIPDGASIRAVVFVPWSQIHKNGIGRPNKSFKLMSSLPPAVLGANLFNEHPCAMAVMRFSLIIADDTPGDDFSYLSDSAMLWDAMGLVGEALHQECSLPSNKWGSEKERNWFVESLEGLKSFTGATGRFGFRKGAHKIAIEETHVITEWQENTWNPVMLIPKTAY